MSNSSKSTSQRKKDHIDLCVNEDVSFKNKTNGFDKYEFEHYATTEVNFDEIDLSSKFFGEDIAYPFIISCMTGGTDEAQSINARLAEAANELKIPIGVGSQRQALESTEFHDTYKIVREKAKDVPVLGNIGAAQISQLNKISSVQYLIDLVEANAMVVHINPLQELIQRSGETNFAGLLQNIEKIAKKIKVPIIAKEVGSGISRAAAKRLLDAGVRGIDVAGAGGTSWSAVEMMRSNGIEDEYLWDWGLPTSYCVREVKKLKKSFYFTLIASGGIESGSEIAKALTLGADLAASARPVLIALDKNGTEGVAELVNGWFDTVKKIMYLVGCRSVKDLQKLKLIKKEDLY